MALEPRLKQLLKRWAELLENGPLPSPEEHCREAPDLLDAFRLRLRQFEHLDAQTHPPTDGRGAPGASVGDATSKKVRFCVDGEPMRGGMGEVFPARDEELGRTVALKFIQRGKGGVDAERRFRREVVITARLQHPGVVPVFGPAVSEDGRSGYAMRFISGESFDAAVTRHHDATIADSSKPTRAGLLNHFEAVCNTMAYAHSKGVIHRDLKPANVMLGRYGETFVVDWGLAKILAEDPSSATAAAEVSAISRAGEDTTTEGLTVVGSTMGTYAYMPPEQAHGDHANLDERADVFALGAMLCKILTGQPPYTGPRVLQMARDAEVFACFVRLDDSGAEPDLINLAKRCLQKSPSDRPRNAQAVLDALRALNADVAARAREDREKRVAAEARSVEERRRRRVTVALAVAVVVVLLVGGAGIWIWQVERSKGDLERKQRELEKNLEAKQFRDDTLASLSVERFHEFYMRFLWNEAENLLDRTEALIGPDGDAAVRERITEARRETAFLKRLDEIRLLKAKTIDGKMDLASALPLYKAAFAEYGFDFDNGDQAALVAKLKASKIRIYLIAALDDWTMGDQTPNRQILKVTQAAAGQTGSEQTWRNQLADVWSDGDKLRSLYDGIAMDERTPALIAGVAWRLQQLNREDKEGLRRVEEGLRQFPGDFWLHVSLAYMVGNDRSDLQLGAYRAALATRPNSSVVIYDMGNLYFRKREFEAAIREYRDAIGLDPRFVMARHNLGMALMERRDYNSAIHEIEEAIPLEPENANLHNGLGMVHLRMRHYELAMSEYDKAMHLDKNNSQTHYGIGCVREALHEDEAATDAYNKAIELDPDFAAPHVGLGNLLVEKQEYKKAAEEYQKAIRLGPHLARAHGGLGFIAGKMKEYPEAISHFEKAIQLEPESAQPHYGLGTVLYLMKNQQGALFQFEEAMRLDPDWARPHWAIGAIHADKEKYKDAVREFEIAIKIDSKLVEPHISYAKVLSLEYEYDAAVRQYLIAIELDPKSGDLHIELGAVYFSLHEYAAAIHEYDKAIQLDDKSAAPHLNWGQVLIFQHDCAAAVPRIEKGIQLAPRAPEGYYLLGFAYRNQGQFKKSLMAFRKAHELMPDNVRYEMLVRETEKLITMEPGLPAIVSGTRKPENAGARILWASLARMPVKKEYALAYYFYVKAFADDSGLIKANRYDAACAAIQFAAGADVRARVDIEEWYYLHEDARTWLAADLKALRKQAASDTPADRNAVWQQLTTWLEDPDLAPVRDPEWQKAMPEDQRIVWQSFWSDVEELRQKLRATRK